MRVVPLPLCFAMIVAAAFADPTGEQRERESAAETVREALRRPAASRSSDIVPTAEVAIGIHTVVVRSVFGEDELKLKPFIAIRSGDYWVVHGTVPKDSVGGTPTTVIRARDGAVLWVFSTE